ncbi:MAG: redox-regulated ATPase YchF [bacterium]
MNISIGIVGLPNVGKSTLFNALTNLQIPAENYPFCTIEPNIGIVAVADKRLIELNSLVATKKIIPAVIEFHDIAGLVKDAHIGEGLGNAFLANIRNTNIIVHLIRDFKTSDVTHVENTVNPKRDKEIIEMELILKDLESVKLKSQKLQKEERFLKTYEKCKSYLLEIEAVLNKGQLVSTMAQSEDEELNTFRSDLFLLTDKQIIYLINGDWNENSENLISTYRKDLEIPERYPILLMNIKEEYELSQLNFEERQEFIEALGIKYSGLDLLTRETYNTLGLISFFTVGPDEIRAWTIKKNSTIKVASGVIHTDFEKKFIAADVVGYQDFIALGGWEEARKNGKLRLEGKEYIVKDGDIVVIKHGA